MVNPFNLADSPEFTELFCDATPEQASASAGPFAQMEQSFVIDEAEQRLHNPVDINVSPDQQSFSTPTEIKLNWQKRCETFFQNRIPTPASRRKSLPLLPPSPIPRALSNDLSFRDTEMVSNSSLMDLSTTLSKFEMGANRDSLMITSSFLSAEQLDCEIDQGCPESPGKVVFTPPLDKSKAMVSSPTPVLFSGSRDGVIHDSYSVSRIRQRLKWDWSPIGRGKNSIIKRREAKDVFKKRRAVKRVKARRRVRSFLGEMNPNIQRGNLEHNERLLKNDRIFGRKQRSLLFRGR